MLVPLLSDHEVARILDCTLRSLQKSRARGDGPPFLRIGSLIRYRPEDIETYIRELPRLRSTSEYSAVE